jgi:hypothetical protein
MTKNERPPPSKKISRALTRKERKHVETRPYLENTAACSEKKLVPGSFVVAAPRSLLADQLRQRRQVPLQLLGIRAGVTALAFAQAGTNLQDQIVTYLADVPEESAE